jgi:hypothetical protein
VRLQRQRAVRVVVELLPLERFEVGQHFVELPGRLVLGLAELR